MDFLIVGLGGFLGAITRYFIYVYEKSTSPHQFPYGTLFINVLGCFIAGILLLASEKLNPAYRQILLFSTMGFIGSFTTFSTFGVETFNLIKSQQLGLALTNIGANLVLGIVAVYSGYLLSTKLFS